MIATRPARPSNDSGTTMLGGTILVSASPAVPSYVIDGLPPVLCVSVTWMHSDPPGGITSGSWLALVLTVNGLGELVPLDPYGAVQVVLALGTAATDGPQLHVPDTPAAVLTEASVLRLPPGQYM